MIFKFRGAVTRRGRPLFKVRAMLFLDLVDGYVGLFP